MKIYVHTNHNGPIQLKLFMILTDILLCNSFSKFFLHRFLLSLRQFERFAYQNCPFPGRDLDSATPWCINHVENLVFDKKKNIKSKFVYQHFIIQKNNKAKFTYILPPLLLKPPYLCAYAMMRANNSSKKGQLWKKTRVLCWSIFLLVYEYVPIYVSTVHC